MKQNKIIFIFIFIIIILCISLFITKNKKNEGFQTQTVSDGYAEACRELIAKRDFLQQYLAQLRMPVQDLSSNMISAKLAKDENMNFQNTFTTLCSNITDLSITNGNTFANNTTQAKACRALASVDKYELSILPDVDVFFGNILYANEANIDYVLQILNFYTNLIKCQMPSSSNVTFDVSENLLYTDPSGNIYTVPPTNHIDISRDLGDLDTATLALELENLSPYYLSPDVVQYIIKFMISQETLDYLNTTSQDYINSNKTLMTKIQTFY